jgi:hypothetical protein
MLVLLILLMIYTIEMASDGMIYIPNFMKIYLGIRVTLRVLPQQLERP